MALSCNIDARGKVVRLLYGIVLMVAAGVLAFFWAIQSGSTVRWVVCVALALMGGFGIFEARAGWCVMRAMGFRTRV